MVCSTAALHVPICSTLRHLLLHNMRPRDCIACCQLPRSVWSTTPQCTAIVCLPLAYSHCQTYHLTHHVFHLPCQFRSLAVWCPLRLLSVRAAGLRAGLPSVDRPPPQSVSPGAVAHLPARFQLLELVHGLFDQPSGCVQPRLRDGRVCEANVYVGGEGDWGGLGVGVAFGTRFTGVIGWWILPVVCDGAFTRVGV